MSKYHKSVVGYTTIDVYDIITLFEVTNPALQHALKKVLMAGKRGHKDFLQDCQDIIDSVERAKAFPPSTTSEVPKSVAIKHGTIVYVLEDCKRDTRKGAQYQYVGVDYRGYNHYFNEEHIVKS